MTLLAFGGETPPLHFFAPLRSASGDGSVIREKPGIALGGICAGDRPGRSPIAPPGRSRRPSAAVSRPPGGWGCALPPRKPAKNPNPSLDRPLQAAGLGPQGSRPADGFGGLRPPTAPLRGAGPAGPPPAQTYPTGIPRSIGCNCRPSSAAASAAPVRESSAARLVGFFRGSSCPKGTK